MSRSFNTTATFASRAPMSPVVEHGWGYAENNPVGMVDVDGRFFIRAIRCSSLTKQMSDYIDKCHEEYDCLVQKYEDLGSPAPEYEAALEFVPKYYRGNISQALAILACAAQKAERDGKSGLVNDWLRTCGINLPFRRK